MGDTSESVDHPRDSAIYWRGPNISETRILEGSMKNAKKKGDPKEKCMLIDKRERWVDYLKERKNKTTGKEYKTSKMNRMKRTCFTQAAVREGIANIITDPNKRWLRLKKAQYTDEKTYFGLST